MQSNIDTTSDNMIRFGNAAISIEINKSAPHAFNVFICFSFIFLLAISCLISLTDDASICVLTVPSHSYLCIYTI